MSQCVHRQQRRFGVHHALGVALSISAALQVQAAAGDAKPLPRASIGVDRADSPQAVRARLWIGQGVGVSSSVAWANTSRGDLAWPMIGVHADIARETRLIYEVNPSAATRAPGADGTAWDAAPRDRWTLEVRPSQNAAQRLRSGLFRVELSGASAVTVKPRKGGVAVAWQSRF